MVGREKIKKIKVYTVSWILASPKKKELRQGKKALQSLIPAQQGLTEWVSSDRSGERRAQGQASECRDFQGSLRA